MTKEEAKNKLRKMGYHVGEDNSVVTVLLPKDVPFKSTLADVRKKLTEIGYKASFCVRQLKDGEQPASEEDRESEALQAETYDGDTIPDEDESDEIATDVTENSDYENNDSTAGSDTADPDAEPEEGFVNDSTEDMNGSDVFGDGEDMILTEDAVQFSLDDFGLGL